MLWALAVIRRHETLELHVRERGAAAVLEPPDLGDDTARRWERQTSHVIAFLVLGLPMVFSPATGALPAIWLPLAALFHVWGSFLLVRLYNARLAEEARHTVTAPVRAAVEGDNPPQRARVAIMLTDMQDYSKSMGLDESGAYARLVEHNRIMRAAIAAHRIGIHFGDVLLTGSDVFGDDVNLAARIEPLRAGRGRHPQEHRRPAQALPHPPENRGLTPILPGWGLTPIFRTLGA